MRVDHPGSLREMHTNIALLQLKGISDIREECLREEDKKKRENNMSRHFVDFK